MLLIIKQTLPYIGKTLSYIKKISIYSVEIRSVNYKTGIDNAGMSPIACQTVIDNEQITGYIKKI